jgi:hypothetical protein
MKEEEDFSIKVVDLKLLKINLMKGKKKKSQKKKIMHIKEVIMADLEEI